MTKTQATSNNSKQELNRLSHLVIIVEQVDGDAITILQSIFNDHQLKTLELFTNSEIDYCSSNITIHKLKQGRQMALAEIKRVAISQSANEIHSKDLDLIIKYGKDQSLANSIITAAAYAEICFINDSTISRISINTAIADYQSRQRNFGS